MLNDTRVRMWLRHWRCWAAGVLATAVLSCLTCSLFNRAPSVPVITGPSAGVVGVPVTFRATATDPEGDSVAFQFDWGDASTLTWTNLVASGETTSVQHAYADSGAFSVKARAKDKTGKEATWSSGHELKVRYSVRDYPDSLMGEIKVLGNASWCALTPDGTRLYVSHSDDSVMTCISTATRLPTATLAVGADPGDLTVLRSGEFLYVACSDDSVVTAIRVSDNRVVASIRVGNNLQGVTSSPDGSAVYVACSMSSLVYVLNTASNTLVDSLDLGGSPADIAVLPNAELAYVSMVAPHKVVALSLPNHQVVAEIPVKEFPTVICATPDSRYVLALTQGDSGLAVINTSTQTVQRTIRISGKYYNDLAVTPDGNYALVTDAYGLRYVQIEAGVVVDSLHYPGGWGRVAVHPTGDAVYVAGGSRVYVVGRR